MTERIESVKRDGLFIMNGMTKAAHISNLLYYEHKKYAVYSRIMRLTFPGFAVK